MPAGQLAFRTALKKCRCLVLADGYYERLKVEKAKQPYPYELAVGKPFAFAGPVGTVVGPDKESDQPLDTCTLITTDANELARKVHDRTPVILDPTDYHLA